MSLFEEVSLAEARRDPLELSIPDAGGMTHLESCKWSRGHQSKEMVGNAEGKMAASVVNAVSILKSSNLGKCEIKTEEHNVLCQED